MAETLSATTASDRLLELAERVERQEGFARVVEALRAGQQATIDGVWGSACALVTAALAACAPGPVVLVAPDQEELEHLADALELFSRQTPERFPAWESLPDEQLIHDEVFGDRLRVLKLFERGEPPGLLLSSIQALLQAVPDRAAMARHSQVVRVGCEVSLRRLARWLVENGFHSTSAVELPGEFSRRGGIIDIFAPDWHDPVRIELFGDQVESIRRFEVSSQRSLGRQESVEITTLDPRTDQQGQLADYLPPDSWLVLVEPKRLEEHARRYLARVERPESLHTVSRVLGRALEFGTVSISSLALDTLEATCRLGFESVERLSGRIDRVREELDRICSGQDVYVVCQTEAEAQRLGEVFRQTRLAADGRLFFALGTLHEGFRFGPEGVVLVGTGQLFGREELRRPVRRRLGRAIDSFTELRENDLVVHVAHGIARYRGLKLLEKGDQVEEHLVLEFQGGTHLYVPSSKIGLVQKYVGARKARPTLARLGGAIWQRQKARVAQAVTDMAAEMLDMQALRASRPGIAFPPDTEWQREFDASFPYPETRDQLTTIEAIKQDMLRSRPMDRLLCGDVGYGKTEVAMRAAFKAVDAGYQVGVLVPTTVLAEQHYRTFCERMAEFPFEIAALSRFATRKEQREIIERLKAGRIDIVIGTHRLVQADVQFHNLGLVVIDEEQRFGVDVKERLKALRHSVDVLTMTATPIPRTLHMGLTGLRDICNLETPPEDRLAVETRITRFQPDLIRHAVMRELSRGGQVFFVHNRVRDIELVAEQLSRIVPEARLRIAHGQMPEQQLDDVMVDFVRRRFDLLLATTIIENGLDIPNANTIFIDEADRYGLADLHQLRGRVGRYKHRAYCYLLVDPRRSLTPNALRRLRAIEEFSDMGAGFAIAMRDLEIRGAGNILGTEQSGHIATVGYELYCQLLEQAVARLKRLPPRQVIEVDVDLPLPAYLPRRYVPDMRQKIDLYRRLARVSAMEEAADFAEELRDRFGTPPEPAANLLRLAELRIAAHQWGIRAIRLEDQYMVLVGTSGPQMRRLAARSAGRLRVVDQREGYLPLDGSGEGLSLLERVKSLLHGE